MDDHRAPLASLCSLLLQGGVAAVNLVEHSVSLLADTKQQPIEAHPLGTSQGRCLHILGTLDERDAYLLRLAVAARVFEGRQHDDVRLDVHDLLHHGVQAVAAVHDASLCNLFVDIGNLDVLRVGHAHNPVAQSEFRQQGTVDGGEDGCPLDGHLNDGGIFGECRCLMSDV